MSTNIKRYLIDLKTATYPEIIFGKDAARLTDAYHEWAKRVHEDLVPVAEKPLAHEAFIILTKLYKCAQEKVKRKTYGDNKSMVMAVFATKTGSYSLTELILSGDIADMYRATTDNGDEVLVKVCRNPANNDLMRNESEVLKKLDEAIDNDKHKGYFPTLVDSFEIGVDKMKKRVNVFKFSPGAVSLEQVKVAYPNGLNGADAAWMCNRMMEALYLLHNAGYVHGGITPDRFLIIPENHHGILIDFCYAVKMGGAIKAVSPKWKHIAAPEIFLKKRVDSGTDLYSASHCMEYITESPIAPTVKGLFRACRLGFAHRSKDAQELHEDFNKVLRRLYGPKKFRVFTMPA